MGVSKFDKAGSHRKLEARYSLDSPAGVRRLLSEYHALDDRRYNGDTAASDILIDLATAIARAGLTDKQRQALALVYIEDLTQEDAGKRLGVRREAIKRHVAVAETKIARTYEMWARMGEGYTLTINEAEAR